MSNDTVEGEWKFWFLITWQCTVEQGNFEFRVLATFYKDEVRERKREKERRERERKKEREGEGEGERERQRKREGNRRLHSDADTTRQPLEQC